MTASINADAITLADPTLQPLLTDGAHVDLAGALDQTGFHWGGITSASTPGPIAVALQGSANRLGQRDGASRRHSEQPRSSLFLAGIAGLKGSGALAANVKLDKAGEALATDLDATLTNASLGIPCGRWLAGARNEDEAHGPSRRRRHGDFGKPRAWNRRRCR